MSDLIWEVQTIARRRGQKYKRIVITHGRYNFKWDAYEKLRDVEKNLKFHKKIFYHKIVL